VQSICETNETKTAKLPFSVSEDPITLDDILNLWDGIRETPGRILVISSNHYKKLDPALTRPGRIDITHELKNASHKTIAEMYRHLFGSPLNIGKLKKIQEFLYSPAELINFYVQYKNEHDFVKRLLENKKIA
jgi:SpoVK/Ycf46/Vps4 family AAA+-type ATPase